MVSAATSPIRMTARTEEVLVIFSFTPPTPKHTVGDVNVVFQSIVHRSTESTTLAFRYSIPIKDTDILDTMISIEMWLYRSTMW